MQDEGSVRIEFSCLQIFVKLPTTPDLDLFPARLLLSRELIFQHTYRGLELGAADPL